MSTDKFLYLFAITGQEDAFLALPDKLQAANCRTCRASLRASCHRWSRRRRYQAPGRQAILTAEATRPVEGPPLITPIVTHRAASRFSRLPGRQMAAHKARHFGRRK